MGRRPSEEARHPGAVASELLARCPDLTQGQVSERLGISRQRLHGILNGKRSVTPDTAFRLGRFFGTTAEFWLRIQARYDLSQTRSPSLSKELAAITPCSGEAGAPPETSLPGELEAEYLREFLEGQNLLDAAERFLKFRSKVDRIASGNVEAG